MGDINIKHLRYEGKQEVIEVAITDKPFIVVKSHYDLEGRLRKNKLIDIRNKCSKVEQYMRKLVEKQEYKIIGVDTPCIKQRGNNRKPEFISKLVRENYLEFIKLMEEIIDEKNFPFVCDTVAPYITKWFVDKGIYATTRYGYGKKGETYHAFTLVEYSDAYVVVDFTRVQFMEDRDWGQYWNRIKTFKEKLPEPVIVPSYSEVYKMYFNNKEKHGGVKLKTDKAYSTQLKEYIEHMLEVHMGFSSGMTPKKHQAYSKIRAKVSKHVGAVRPLTQEQYMKAIRFVDDYLMMPNNELTEKSGQLVRIYGSIENFFNSKANRYDDQKIDQEMRGFVTKLNHHGIYTVGCHYRSNGDTYVNFASFIKGFKIREVLEELGVNRNQYDLVEMIHHIGGFRYYRVVILDKDILNIK